MSRGTNNGGGARWGLMAWGVCPRCGLKHRIGVRAEMGQKSPECTNRRKCDERRKKRELIAVEKAKLEIAEL